ncbi:TetR/AcrR family transcriptional regulator [Lentilactobacillus kribbianus]|uniref:TetR/AcrR family transcriptional regulator n=1 Tax=Lentilactobacillus kribbianus TaxID=2729622 RepID=UPI001552A07F|nr:TetR/AcrR family transcriptional regulator [Lentilactobacillus kribbianus]
MAVDKRTAQTKQRIIAALIELINEKGFNDINVTDISRRAGISRGTFYIHYLDKFDLLHQVEAELLGKLQQTLDDMIPKAIKQLKDEDNVETFPYQMVISTLSQFFNDRELLTSLLSNQGDPAFLSQLKGLFSTEIRKKFLEFNGTVTYDAVIPKDYIEEMVLDTLMGIVLHWLSKDNPEPAAEVAQIILQYRVTAPQNWIKID